MPLSVIREKQPKIKVIKENIVQSPFPPVDIPYVSFSDFIYRHLRKHGDKLFMIDAETNEKWSYKSTADVSIRVASGLNRLGLQCGEVVCLFSSNKPEYVVTFLAVATVGAVVTCANPLFTVGELLTQLKDTKSVIIVSDQTNVKKAIEAAKALNTIRKVIVFGNEQDGCISFSQLKVDDGLMLKRPMPFNLENHMLFIPYSSGTTGLPKGVVHTHYSFLAGLCQSMHPEAQLLPTECISLLVLPLYHVYALLLLWHSATIGGTVVILSRFSPTLFLSSVEKYAISSLPLVPPLVSFLLNYPSVDKYNLNSVTDIVCAAAPLAKELQSHVRRKYGIDIRQNYGMTESAPITITPMNYKFHRGNSVGVPVPSTKMKVLDTGNGQVCRPRELGEICVQAPYVMKEYLNNPEATARTIDENGWIHTGDFGYYDEDGYFYITDRLKEIIKYKGHQVAPAELEALLLTHPAVQDAAVVGFPDERAGELPRAFIVLKSTNRVTEKEITDFVAERTSPEKHLRGGVIFIEEIPKSRTGKILRKELICN